jgi:hypothetical protein
MYRVGFLLAYLLIIQLPAFVTSSHTQQDRSLGKHPQPNAPSNADRKDRHPTHRNHEIGKPATSGVVDRRATHAVNDDAATAADRPNATTSDNAAHESFVPEPPSRQKNPLDKLPKTAQALRRINALANRADHHNQTAAANHLKAREEAQ